jgi:hypothetical protein
VAERLGAKNRRRLEPPAGVANDWE